MGRRDGLDVSRRVSMGVGAARKEGEVGGCEGSGLLSGCELVSA